MSDSTVDPLLKDLDQEKMDKIKKAVSKKVREIPVEDILDKDELKVNGQNYALISVVSPSSNQKSSNICLKIKGVFKTIEEANERAKSLQKVNDMFDIYVVEMYSWLLLPPPTSENGEIKEHFVNEKLDNIIRSHYETQIQSKTFFEERKKELMNNIVIDPEDEEEEQQEQEQQVKEENQTNDAISDKVTEIPQHGAESGASEVLTGPNGENCPNSGPDTTPTQLMESMMK